MKSDQRHSGSPRKWREGSWGRGVINRILETGVWGNGGSQTSPQVKVFNHERRTVRPRFTDGTGMHRFIWKQLTLPQTHTFQRRKQVRKAPGIASSHTATRLEGRFTQTRHTTKTAQNSLKIRLSLALVSVSYSFRFLSFY